MSFALPGSKKAQYADTQAEPVSPDRVPTVEARPYSFFYVREWMLIVSLALAAFIPRLILALQLDFFTDESMYIQAGEYYLKLLSQFNFTSPDWQFNHEHPAFAKLLMGLSIDISHYFHSANPLFPARLPSVLLGTFLVLATYMLGKSIVGRTVALLAALSLAFSPWVAFWSSQAMLDTTMMTLITLACLVLWSAIRRPRLYALCGILIGLAGASKYTSALVIPGMILFLVYYYGFLRRALPKAERPPLPWRWWLIGLCLIPVSFFLADPPIWLDPLPRLASSLAFSLTHSEDGHLTFWAGQILTHVPPWMIFYVVFGKVSAFVTIPAAFFAVFATVQVVRFHLRHRAHASQIHPATDAQVQEIAGLAFLCIWLVTGFLFFGQLNILVGTHYYLPVAPPLFLAGAFGLTILVRALVRRLLPVRSSQQSVALSPSQASRPRFNWRSALAFTVLVIALVGPHLFGLITVPDAEGYTSEFFNGENSTLAVMYLGYSNATEWLVEHSKTGGTVGLVGNSSSNWSLYHPEHAGKLQFIPVNITDKTFPFDYLVWPMNFIQRGLGPPPPWKERIVHTINGGSTTYIVIMALNPSTVTS